MNAETSHPVINDISSQLDSLTPKAQALGIFIMQNPSEAVFMTTKELADACGTSEATVVRFADLSLVVPARSIPFIGNGSGMLVTIQYIVQELASQRGEKLGDYQKELEQVYLENDIFLKCPPEKH